MKVLKYICFYTLILFLFAAGTCDKNCNGAPSRYEFVIPVSLTPTLDTFRVGDTIKISSVFSKDVYERNTDKIYSLVDFDFRPITRIVRIDTSVSYDALDDFEIIVANEYNYYRFDASDGTQIFEGEYSYDDSIGYHLKYDIVMLSQGTYWVSHQPAIEFNRMVDFPGKCDLSGVAGVGELNENSDDNNIHLFETSPDPHFSEWRLQKPQERFYDGASYAFVVIE